VSEGGIPDNTGFSVREQLAAMDPGHMTPPSGGSVPGGGAAPGNAAPSPSPSPSAAPLEPLRRRVSAENILRMVDWQGLLHGILKRSWLILLIGVAALGLGIAGARRLGALRYDARASLLYRADRQSQATSAIGNRGSVKGLARATAVSLLRRASALDTVIERLKLPMTSEELGWRIRIQTDRYSEIILLHVEHMPTADSAIGVANELARVGLAENAAFYREQATRQAAPLQQQLDSAREEWNTAREALTTFQSEYRLLEVAADTKAFLDSMGAVSERLQSARIARDAQDVRIGNYEELIAKMPAEVLRESFEDNPVKRRLANTEVALMEARARYGPENPQVLQMEDSIREMRRTLADSSFDESRERVYVPNPDRKTFELEILRLKAEREVLDQALTQTDAQAQALQQRYAHLPDQQVKLAAHLQRYAAAESLYRSLERAIADARVAADLDLADFEMLEPARRATASRSRMASILPIAALLLGLLGATGLCVIIELSDPRYRSARQLEQLYAIPCLASVPTAPRDALDAACLPACRLIYQHVNGQPSARPGGLVICIASAGPQEGRSTLAGALARYWASLGATAAVVDFTATRNPMQPGAQSTTGLERYLEEDATWDEVIVRDGSIDGLKRAFDRGNLPELLHGKAMRRLMETLRARYACVVIEAPPWQDEPQAGRMLAQASDRLIWLIDRERSSRRIVNPVFDALDRYAVRPLGIVFNRDGRFKPGSAAAVGSGIS